MKAYNPKDYHQQKCKSTLFDKNLRRKITSMKFENCEARLTLYASMILVFSVLFKLPLAMLCMYADFF